MNEEILDNMGAPKFYNPTSAINLCRFFIFMGSGRHIYEFLQGQISAMPGGIYEREMGILDSTHTGEVIMTRKHPNPPANVMKMQN